MSTVVLLSIMLALYLAIGMLFAYTVLAEVYRRSDVRVRDTAPARIARFVLFWRWTAGWLPIVMYYWVK